MHSTKNTENFQFPISSTGYISLPSDLEGFVQTSVSMHTTVSGANVYELRGFLESQPGERICPVCAGRLHIKGTKDTTLRHVPLGSDYVHVTVRQERFY